MTREQLSPEEFWAFYDHPSGSAVTTEDGLEGNLTPAAYLRAAIGALQSPDPKWRSSLRRVDRSLWNFANRLGTDFLPRDNVDIQSLGDVLHALALFIAARYARARTWHQGMYMCWDAILFGREDEPDARLAGRIEEALAAQLASENRFVRFSAIHGLGHLGTVRAREILGDFFLAHRDGGDVELLDFVRDARGGEIL